LKTYLLLIFFFSASSIFSQWDSIYTGEGDALEDLLQETDEEADYSAASDAVEEMINNPVDLNSAGVSDLLSIPYIDLNTADKIVEYRKKFGPFFSAGEIYSIKEISRETAAKILPFLYVKQDFNKKGNEIGFLDNAKENFNLVLRSRVAKDLQTREGYKENKFTGSPYKYYNRILAGYSGKYEAGILTEKDPGEKQFNEFTSFFFSAKDIGLLKNLVAGDYTVEAGQGITLWSPYGFAKGGEAVFPIKKHFKNIKPYKSTDENKFFRGAAAEIGWENFSISAFYSKNKFDAGIDSSASAITSVQLTGYHRTNNELLKRKTAEEILTGTKADARFELGSGESNIKINIGVLHYYSRFSKPFLAANAFDLSGTSFRNSSLYYDFYYHGVNFFGEVSYNGISAASINGLIISLSSDFSFTSSIRSYPRNFFSLHGSSLAENSPKNELGFYNGIKWKTLLGTINFYYDQFKFPYAGYETPLPASGNEFLFSLESKPFARLKTKLRIKGEDKEIGVKEDLSKIISGQIKKSLRAEMVYTVSRAIRLKGRFEVNNFLIEDLKINEHGFLFFQDIRITLLNQITISGRITFFKTGSFNSAVYSYENDLQGISSNSALYGEGMNWYLLLRYKPIKNIAFSCKYSELYKPVEKSLYSADEEITGNLDNRFAFQLDLNF